ncbi:LytR/AlgR family response regulator transcription factor [Pedobacter mendelii]|uniref:LytR/AlgR family response regulator transcription factor n=1 Tax=Pedobacter mendelii TaxID=1908240 RepID=UPI00166605FB|nr:LytTR family DNA-binding domain-containing protein [Pedobacter mendelii]
MIQTQRLIIPHNNVIHLVDPMDIVFCKSDNYYTHLHLSEGGQYLLVKSLARFEKELARPEFIRVNQSYLVNMFHIKNINKKEKSLRLNCDTTIPFTISLKKLIAMIY